MSRGKFLVLLPKLLVSYPKLLQGEPEVFNGFFGWFGIVSGRAGELADSANAVDAHVLRKSLYNLMPVASGQVGTVLIASKSLAQLLQDYCLIVERLPRVLPGGSKLLRRSARLFGREPGLLRGQA